VASCSSGIDPGEDAAPLRLGTHFGVAVMDPVVTGTFTRNLIDLVYNPLSTYFSAVSVEGTRVRLRARPEAATNLAALAPTIVHPELVGATVEGDQVVLEMKSADAASSIDLDSYLVPDGAYRALESTVGHLLLGRRVPGDGPARIEVTAVPTSEEEWRRFLSGDFDAMPYVLPGVASYLRQVPTIRLIRLSEPAPAALWFRMDGGPTKDPALRRAIAALIGRKALALSVTGNASDARTDEREDPEARQALLAAGILPERPVILHLLVDDAQSDLVRAAMVLQQQLDGVGIELRIDALPQDAVRERLATHDFDLMLFAGDRTPRYWGFIHPGPGNINGYVSEDFAAAVKAGDAARAKEILDRDLPVTPLFNQAESVAVRRELCNVHPHNTADLGWLAEIRRCRPGEDE
jgi:hypothetical protein